MKPKKKPVEQTKLDSENPANYVDWIPPKSNSILFRNFYKFLFLLIIKYCLL